MVGLSPVSWSMPLLDRPSSAVIAAAEGSGGYTASAGKRIIFKSIVTCGDNSSAVENLLQRFCVKVRGTSGPWQISQHPDGSTGGAEEI